jgi:hypothetical protein
MARYFPVSVYVPRGSPHPGDDATTDAHVIATINGALNDARLDYRLVPLDPAQFVRDKPKQRGRRKARR